MKATPKAKSRPTSRSNAVGAEQRALQRNIDRKDAGRKSKSESKKPVQAGARKQPSQMPAQHLAKPGHESALELAPRFEAPHYRGSGKLEGMAAIVTGADSGIGRAVAVLFAREGADVAIFYLDEHEDAEETARWVREHGYHSIRLVTSDWHMARARMELANALDPDVTIVDDGVKGEPDLRLLIAEYNKLLLRRIALWLGIGG